MLGSPRPQPSSSVRAPRSARPASARASASELGHSSAQYGQELLVLERLLVEQRVAVARAQQPQVAAVERDHLLDQVFTRRSDMVVSVHRLDRIPESRASTSRAARACRSRPSRWCCPGSRAGASPRRPRPRCGGRPRSWATGPTWRRARCARARPDRRPRGHRRHAPVLRAGPARRAGGGVARRLRGRAGRRRQRPRPRAGVRSRRCAPGRSTASCSSPSSRPRGRRARRGDRGVAAGHAVRALRHRARDRARDAAPARARPPADRPPRLRARRRDVPPAHARRWLPVLGEAGLEPGAVRAGAVPLRRRGARRGELLDGPDADDAIFCDDDLLAGGVYLAARERGLRIPEDVSVVGFDDLPFAQRLRAAADHDQARRRGARRRGVRDARRADGRRARRRRAGSCRSSSSSAGRPRRRRATVSHGSPLTYRSYVVRSFV